MEDTLKQARLDILSALPLVSDLDGQHRLRVVLEREVPDDLFTAMTAEEMRRRAVELVHQMRGTVDLYLNSIEYCCGVGRGEG